MRRKTRQWKRSATVDQAVTSISFVDVVDVVGSLLVLGDALADCDLSPPPPA
jgi:hypothetical protein